MATIWKRIGSTTTGASAPPPVVTPLLDIAITDALDPTGLAALFDFGNLDADGAPVHGYQSPLNLKIISVPLPPDTASATPIIAEYDTLDYDALLLKTFTAADGSEQPLPFANIAIDPAKLSQTHSIPLPIAPPADARNQYFAEWPA